MNIDDERVTHTLPSAKRAVQPAIDLIIVGATIEKMFWFAPHKFGQLPVVQVSEAHWLPRFHSVERHEIELPWMERFRLRE